MSLQLSLKTFPRGWGDNVGGEFGNKAKGQQQLGLEPTRLSLEIRTTCFCFFSNLPRIKNKNSYPMAISRFKRRSENKLMR